MAGAPPIASHSRPPGLPRRLLGILPEAIVHAGALGMAGMVLAAAGQPIFAEDTWWHLSMGEAYAARGPWLDADPLLHTAAAPPAPAAWLADLGLYAVERAAGFQGLRGVHALLVAAVLALAWSALRRASGSRAFASLGTAVFAALAAYRLFQLRPHLGTLLAALLVVRLLVQTEGPPSRRRVAVATGIFALWANVHAGFVLGLVLLGAALGGVALAALLGPGERTRHLARSRRLAAALALGLLATLLNPAGARLHLLYASAGGATPELGVVADEWARFPLSAPPGGHVPPTPLTWILVWGLVVGTPCAAALHVRWQERRGAPRAPDPPDPAILAIGATALAGMLAAVRLAWLGVLALLVVGGTARARVQAPPRGVAAAAALAALLLVAAFARYGDWPAISPGVRPARYADPYPAVKFHAHAVWFLRDAGLEGRLWNDYGDGNFLGAWLAPRMRVFLNGSLNVPPEILEAGFAIRERRGARPGESFTELLDRLGIDVFFATGVPAVPRPGRAAPYTTTHLEHTPGWILVFRSARNAVYLRRNDRNRENLRRVADYYAERGVPFDLGRGLSPERALHEAPRWATAAGLAPIGLDGLERAAGSLEPTRAQAARERLASSYALIGLYDLAARVDRRILATRPRSVSAARRLVWSLLHGGDAARSREAAETLARVAPPGDGLSRLLVEAARRHPERPGEEARARIASLPLFSRNWARAILAGFSEPEPRTERLTLRRAP